MATEDQIQQLWQDIIRLEERIDYCCRDIVFWDFQVRIRDKYGNIISDYLANRRTGIMRRGKNFVMEIPLTPIAKYEQELKGSNIASHYVDGNTRACTPNGSRFTYINDLCSILYRGTEGTYFNMSVRQGDYGLGFARTNVQGASTSLVMNYVRNDGSIGTTDYMIPAPLIPVNTHFAYVENNKLYVSVNYPIPMDPVTFAQGDTGLAYGAQYRLDVRDVTLGD